MAAAGVDRGPDPRLGRRPPHRALKAVWPRRESGPIPGVWSVRWSAVHAALQKGHWGLPGGSSLPRLLAARRGVRNRKGLAPLTVTQILRWADVYRRRTGTWPHHHSEPRAIPGSHGETAALAPKHQGGKWEENHAANQEILRLERELAAARGEEYVEPVGFPLRWDAGAPMPHLMVTDHRALLAFLLSEPDPAWDGSYVTIKGPGDEQSEPLGLVEFDFCTSAKLGAPNDEVIEGHPLSGKGLEAYGAQRVVNSRWVKELEAINSVHRTCRPESWRDRTHYVFWFHDSTIECVARSFKVETHRTSMRALLGRMDEGLIS